MDHLVRTCWPHEFTMQLSRVTACTQQYCNKQCQLLGSQCPYNTRIFHLPFFVFLFLIFFLIQLFSFRWMQNILEFIFIHLVEKVLYAWEAVMQNVQFLKVFFFRTGRQKAYLHFVSFSSRDAYRLWTRMEMCLFFHHAFDIRVLPVDG